MSMSPGSDRTMKPLTVFGAEVRKYRKMAGLSQDRLAEIIQFSQSLIGFIERGERTPSHNFAQRCDDALQAGGELVHLWAQVTRAASPRWFRGWLDIEQEAHTLHTWQPLVVPGLLQTEEYARVVIRGEPGISDEQVERAVSARMERQKILARNAPPMLRVVLDEGVLHRPIGGKEIMRRQLKHLIETLESPRVGIQIVPLVLGATTGTSGGFTIAQLPGGGDTVYIESANCGQVTSRSEDVEAICTRYDTIRADAHPQHVSVELIREAEKSWT
ncbi:transcriptional regulator with XRE-family HTH domain [Streptosporangium becharense]|uniref:Transcriptional regulator with XRE-family HTH domain n=1 Tax=Streptosporangium becharense TaxID=1816182 RepID=A0A7W9IJW6_9ACTN|nr:helix-turn-helix transcriptional regulator [Streptosporangium becharense]MBB2913945.1 transcriptional regulator with XRE-family HTH domain [Streptosporangium becharense]MBB5821394.1 transcriptional regulator with XRE-family HTH domain [Streptosporangium becharense]